MFFTCVYYMIYPTKNTTKYLIQIFLSFNTLILKNKTDS